jgi:hypothetical protein
MVPASSPSTPSSCKQTRFMAKMKKKNMQDPPYATSQHIAVASSDPGNPPPPAAKSPHCWG